MYKKEFNLKDNEAPAKIDLETGEMTLLQATEKNIAKVKNINVVDFQHNELFQRTYIKSWNLLRTQTTDKEFKIATLLALKAKPFTNSLEPLNDDATSEFLASQFSVSRNGIKDIFDKLFKLGVYGKFELHDNPTNFKKYWIFNPYLSFNGNKIDKSILGLFEDSVYKSVVTS